MKEIFEKIITQIKSKAVPLGFGLIPEDRVIREADAISIVERVAEEYNGGWISVSDRLPELTEGTECFKQSPCCLVTLKWWDGDMTESVGWYNQSGVWNEDSKNCKVVAWMPLPEPFKPKGD